MDLTPTPSHPLQDITWAILSPLSRASPPSLHVFCSPADVPWEASFSTPLFPLAVPVFRCLQFLSCSFSWTVLKIMKQNTRMEMRMQLNDLSQKAL